jgi:polyisoprenoid-binding protein YceI
MVRARTIGNMPFAVLFVLASNVLALTSRAQAPVFANQPNSSIRFSVNASIPITGKFDKWEATLKFASPDVTTGSLDIKAHAASVDTGSGFEDDKLRSGDFFNADHDPYITFQATRVVPTGPNTFSLPGYVHDPRGFKA